MIKISRQDLRGKELGEVYEFPQFTDDLIQLANQKCHATTQKNVGKMGALVASFSGENYDEWKHWYETQQPGAIDRATDRIWETMQDFQNALSQVDRELVRRWVEEFVLKKTYAGSRLQEVILKKIARIKNSTFRLPNAKEESRGIDGFIGNRPTRIRPVSYYFKAPPSDGEELETIYYEKVKNGIKVYADL